MAQKPPKASLNVLVLCGGPGREREVSLASGREVVKALQTAGHYVRESDITPDYLAALDHRDIDVIFIALHGPFGEGGQLQKILEDRSLCYVGSGPGASRLAMNKAAAKKRFSLAQLPTPDSLLFTRDDNVDEIDRAIEEIGLPCVLKPNEDGSSVGIVMAQTKDRARQAIKDVCQKFGNCLIEQMIRGRELTVGILGQMPLPVLEICTRQSFYDYQAKYLDDDTQYLFDLDLETDLIGGIQSQALAAFNALGCRDFGRVDFMLDNHQRPYILEVNTIPGLTTHSLLPKAAARAGMAMPQMCDEIVLMAYNRPIK